MLKKSKMALNTRPIVRGIMESIQAMIISNIIGHNATCASASISSTESSSKNPANTHPMNAYIMIPIIILILSHLLSSVKVQFINPSSLLYRQRNLQGSCQRPHQFFQAMTRYRIHHFPFGL